MAGHKARNITYIKVEKEGISSYWVPELHYVIASTALKESLDEFNKNNCPLTTEKARAVSTLEAFDLKARQLGTLKGSPLLACFFESDTEAYRETKELYEAIETLGFGLPFPVGVDEAKCFQNKPIINHPTGTPAKTSFLSWAWNASGASLCWELLWNKSRLSGSTPLPDGNIVGTFIIPTRKHAEWLYWVSVLVAALFAVGAFLQPGAIVGWFPLALLVGTLAIERFQSNLGRFTRFFMFFENIRFSSRKFWRLDIPFPEFLYHTYEKGFLWLLLRGMFFCAILCVLYYQNSSYVKLLQALQAGPGFLQVALLPFSITGVTLTLSWVLANIIFGLTVFCLAALIYDCCSQFLGWNRNIPLPGSPVVLPYSTDEALVILKRPASGVTPRSIQQIQDTEVLGKLAEGRFSLLSAHLSFSSTSSFSVPSPSPTSAEPPAPSAHL